MANRNVDPNYTLEAFRLEFNELSTDVGDFNSGITNSIPSGQSVSTNVETVVNQLITDVNSIIDGTYTFTGNPVTFGNVDITGNLDVGGDITLAGTITIGDDQTIDTVNVVATLDSNLIPTTTSTYDIGSSSKIWNNIYVNDVNVVGVSSLSLSLERILPVTVWLSMTLFVSFTA